MSKVELEKYLKSYNLLLELLVEYHNRHSVFIKHFGRENVRELRKIAKKMYDTQKALYRGSMAGYYEHRNNTKEKLAKKRLERTLSPNIKKSPERKKKNEQHNSTTSNDV